MTDIGVIKTGAICPAEVLDRRKLIEKFEIECRKLDTAGTTEELKQKTKHHFCDGVYAREFFLPAGHMCTGRVHKRPCFNVLLTGHITLNMGALTSSVEMCAPQFFISEAGEKKALYAFEDTIFITFHATPETDPDKLWDILAVDTIDEFYRYNFEKLLVDGDT